MKKLTEEKWVYLTLIAAGLFVSIFSVYFTQAEDMGIFLSVSSLLTKGYKLYKDVFEIKDPIFFYSAAGMIKIFGLRGAFLIDFILITMSPICSYAAMKNLEFRKLTCFISSILFTLTLTGVFYQPFRTQIFGILLLIISISMIGKNNFLVGVLLSIIFFTKMNLIVFYPVIVLLILQRKQNYLKNFRNIALGYAASSSLIVIFMVARGEFKPYIDMIRVNFRYADSYQKIVGLPEGIFGHFKLWNSNLQSFSYYLVALILIAIFIRSNGPQSLSRIQIGALISINISTFFFLGLTNLWVHHLQILSLSLLINFACAFEVLLKSDLFQYENSKLTQKNHDKTFLRVLTWILAALCLVQYSGLVLPIKPKMNLEKWVDPNWILPPEIIALNSKIALENTPINVARIGMNDDLAYGAFLDTKKFNYKCRRLYIVGFETKAEINSFLSCVSKNVDLLTVGPMFEGIDRPYGNYSWYKIEANRMLNENFKCYPDDSRTYRICRKK